ncbi:MAG: hypothetical protein WBN75_04875 [Verrucomicrobiia bacterium]
MNPVNEMSLALLAVLGFVLGSGTLALVWLLAVHRQMRSVGLTPRPVEPFPSFQLAFAPRPASWLAIRSLDRNAVQAALGLNHYAPCSWAGGMTGGHGFFIGPPVNGWIIVTGSGLPKPDGDADECFRFLTELSRKLGHVQFFQSEQALHHHAWVRVENGVVKRAYAWAGETVWNQGAKTAEETELSMKCFSYGEPPGAASWAAAEWMAANAAKVPLLAARWSLDPARIDGRLRKHVAGESPRPD